MTMLAIALLGGVAFGVALCAVVFVMLLDDEDETLPDVHPLKHDPHA